MAPIQTCRCCGSPHLRQEWAATSSFFAHRALRRAPEAVPLSFCHACSTRYFDFPLTDDDLGRLYAGYRGEEYFSLRHGFEPWYTRAVNDDLGGELGMAQRRAALAGALAEAGIAPVFTNVLDHGGDRGQILRDLNAGFKAVYEISGVAADAGVVAIDAAQLKTRAWDLVLSCHVLEHLTAPETYVAELVSLGHPGTVYFFEVPNERFRSFSLNGSGAQKSWISWAAKRPALFKLLDFLSTGIRIRLSTVPPLLFLFLREHLTFFTIDGLSRLLERHALSILSAKILATGHIGVLARHSGDQVVEPVQWIL